MLRCLWQVFPHLHSRALPAGWELLTYNSSAGQWNIRCVGPGPSLQAGFVQHQAQCVWCGLISTLGICCARTWATQRGLGWLCWKTETQCMPLPSSSWGGGAPSSLQPVPSSQLSHITGLCLDLLILWRRLTCGLEVRRVACLWLAKACVLKDALAPNDFLSVGLASRTDAQPWSEAVPDFRCWHLLRLLRKLFSSL